MTPKAPWHTFYYRFLKILSICKKTKLNGSSCKKRPENYKFTLSKYCNATLKILYAPLEVPCPYFGRIIKAGCIFSFTLILGLYFKKVHWNCKRNLEIGNLKRVCQFYNVIQDLLSFDLSTQLFLASVCCLINTRQLIHLLHLNYSQ